MGISWGEERLDLGKTGGQYIHVDAICRQEMGKHQEMASEIE